jgi:hypothetical protein
MGTMADMNTLLQALRDGIADATAVKTWCTTNYTRNHKVYIGRDQENPPDDEAYPIVSLYPISKGAGNSEDEKKHTFGVMLGIYDSSLATGGKTNVVEYNGVQRIEAFRKLVSAAVIAALTTVRITDIAITYEALELFPYFLCEQQFTCVEETEFGDDFLE